MTKKPHLNMELDQYEQEIHRAIENGELTSELTDERREELAASARATHIKDQRINMRLTSSDLHDLKAQALREGMPYQTLLSSIVHKYVTGQLVERENNRVGQRGAA